MGPMGEIIKEFCSISLGCVVLDWLALNVCFFTPFFAAAGFALAAPAFSLLSLEGALIEVRNFL